MKRRMFGMLGHKYIKYQFIRKTNLIRDVFDKRRQANFKIH